MRQSVNLGMVLWLSVSGTAIGSAVDNSAVPLWGRWEAAYQATARVEQPSDLQFWLDLTTPSGKKVRTFGFWDGDSTWRTRFMPTEEGEWKFTAHTIPATAGLDGQSGSFVCRKVEAKPDSLLARGPLRVANSGTHLEHADGTPFF